MKPRFLLLAAPVVVAGALIAGYSATNDTVASPPAATASSAKTGGAVAATDGQVTVTTTEFAFSPMEITTKPGKLKLTLVNDGKVEHEIVVLKTNQAAGAMKVSGGRVSESTSVGEVSETAAGATKSTTLDLKAGKYVIVCNISGHYQAGMRGTLTVQ
jgi:uncharacterized cupredoxin-like copper-binding protein